MDSAGRDTGKVHTLKKVTVWGREATDNLTGRYSSVWGVLWGEAQTAVGALSPGTSPRQAWKVRADCSEEGTS